MSEINHLAKAQQALETLSKTTSNSPNYIEGLMHRAEVEALVSIAESLKQLVTALDEEQKK